MKKYWVAHVRGGEHPRLAKLGFVSFYPAMDDYVFLEATQQNTKHHRKQAEHGISFLKAKGDYVTITETELGRMKGQTQDKLTQGQRIKVVQGYLSNLEGVITETDGLTAKVILDGRTRKYEAELPLGELAAANAEVSSPQPEDLL